MSRPLLGRTRTPNATSAANGARTCAWLFTGLLSITVLAGLTSTIALVRQSQSQAAVVGASAPRAGIVSAHGFRVQGASSSEANGGLLRGKAMVEGLRVAAAVSASATPSKSALPSASGSASSLSAPPVSPSSTASRSAPASPTASASAAPASPSPSPSSSYDAYANVASWKADGRPPMHGPAADTAVTAGAAPRPDVDPFDDGDDDRGAAGALPPVEHERDLDDGELEAARREEQRAREQAEEEADAAAEAAAAGQPEMHGFTRRKRRPTRTPKPSPVPHGFDNEPIPKHIYVTWGTKTLPPRMAISVAILRLENPEFNVTIMDDDDARAFIQNEYIDEPEALAAFDNMIPGAYKGDFLRFAVLYKKGGAFVDAKYGHSVSATAACTPSCRYACSPHHAARCNQQTRCSLLR